MAIVLLLLLFAATPAHGQACAWYEAFLDAAAVVPPTESPGEGLVIVGFECLPCPGEHGDSLKIGECSWMNNLGETPVALRFCEGAPGENGPVLNEVPLSGQGSATGRKILFDPTKCEALESRSVYVTITTAEHPDGLIRGQLEQRSTPLRPTTWGRIRALFRNG